MHKRGTSTSMLSASKRFGRYKRKAEKRCLKAEVDEMVLPRLIDALHLWHRSCQEADESHPWLVDDYEVAFEILKEMDISPPDIQKICLALQDFEGESSRDQGIFISAMINSSPHESFELSVHHLDDPLDSLCQSNCKDVKVIGDVGSSFGSFTESGDILLDGAAGNELGLSMLGGMIEVVGSVGKRLAEGMKGGEITVQGDAGSFDSNRDITMIMEGLRERPMGIAEEMEGGKLIINGDAYGHVGHKMTGGEVHVYGKLEGLGRILGGRIFHKGKLIVDK